MLLRCKLKPMPRLVRVLRLPTTEVVSIRKETCAGTVPLFRSLAEELRRELRILPHARAPRVGHSKVHLGRNGASRCRALEPARRPRGIALHSYPRLVEVPDLELRFRFFRVGCFLFLVGLLFLVSAF